MAPRDLCLSLERVAKATSWNAAFLYQTFPWGRRGFGKDRCLNEVVSSLDVELFARSCGMHRCFSCCRSRDCCLCFFANRTIELRCTTPIVFRTVTISFNVFSTLVLTHRLPTRWAQFSTLRCPWFHVYMHPVEVDCPICIRVCCLADDPFRLALVGTDTEWDNGN